MYGYTLLQAESLSVLFPVVITSGNVMAKRIKSGPTAEQFISETVALIEEKGGSHDVNLREVSRRVGCAHTNAYNYFASFEALLWASYHRAILIYDDYMTRDLLISSPDYASFRLVIERLVKFPLDHPGLYRFIGSDNLPIENMPPEVIDAVRMLKGKFIEGVKNMNRPKMNLSDALEISNILLAYISGESFDYINGRVLPDEDLPERTVKNALRIYGCLTAGLSNGAGK